MQFLKSLILYLIANTRKNDEILICLLELVKVFFPKKKYESFSLQNKLQYFMEKIHFIRVSILVLSSVRKGSI